jgi:hypothetical protein
MFIDTLIASPHGNITHPFAIPDSSFEQSIQFLIIYDIHTHIHRTQLYIKTCWMGLAVHWLLCPIHLQGNIFNDHYGKFFPSLLILICQTLFTQIRHILLLTVSLFHIVPITNLFQIQSSEESAIPFSLMILSFKFFRS